MHKPQRRVVLYGLGMVMLVLAASMLVPLPWAFVPGQESWKALLYSAVPTGAVGLVLFLLGRGENEVRRRDTYLLVTLAWVVAASVGALPYLWSGVLPTFTDGFFEAMSGFTTTGSSVIPNVEIVPPAILFWRSLTHWLGGMGIMVLLVALLSSFGVGGLMVMRAEAPGPTVERLSTRVRETAQALWVAYVVLTAILVAIQVALGMSLFDALNHAFATMATGGFSTRNASLGAFSPAIQWVHTFFMWLAGVNFALIVGSFNNRSLKTFWRDPEFRLYTWVSAGTSLAVSAILVNNGMGLLDALRHGFFNVISVLTTTGYATQDFSLWAPGALGLLGLMSVAGAMTGSTGGAIKMLRHLVLFKQAAIEFGKQLQPRLVRQVQINNRTVPEEMVINIQQFFFLYLGALGVGFLVIASTGLDIVSAFSAAAATLGNIGPGLGVVGPVGNFSTLTDLAKWTGSILMLLGRLELYTVLVLFSPVFWRR